MGLFTKDKSQNSPSTIEAGNIDFGNASGAYNSGTPEERAAINLDPINTSPASNQTLKLSYGIEDTIQLMRTMPNQNDEMVMAIIQKTLESVNVHVEDIVIDATSKENRIEARVETLIKEIKDLSSKITEREGEISALRTDLSETQSVRESLESVVPKSKIKEESKQSSANDELENRATEEASPPQDKSSAIPA